MAKKDSDWVKLGKLIVQFAEDWEVESWKGGGDPEEIPKKEKALERTRKKLNEHLQYMEANYAKKP